MNILLSIFAGSDSILVNALFLLIGIFIVLKGGDWLTDGAASIARKAGMSQIVIGLTIVAMGTSMPEFCVSMVSALNGTTDLAMGNVVGSNIFNTLLIVGCSALVAPVVVGRNTIRRDFPFTVAASAALLLLALDGEISRLDSFMLLAGFCFFIYFTLRNAKGEAEADDNVKQRSLLAALLLMAVGLACLVAGSNLFVQGASFVAKQFGMSDAVIGLTIVAGGTSLPELATSIVAARKGNSEIAIGNVLGSNVFNILMIIGITGAICPLQVEGITTLDYVVLIVGILLVWLFSRTKYTVERWEGLLLTAIFVCYIVYLSLK